MLEPGRRESPSENGGSFALTEEAAGQTVAAVVREKLGVAWSTARTLCERGKVFLDGKRLLDPAVRVRAGTRLLEVRPREKSPLAPHRELALESLVYEDAQLIVIDKPAGMSSVPYERGETGTAMDWVREAWRAQGRRGAEATGVPLHIVHRIDKDTSGLLLFAKTKQAERSLQLLWRQHDIERRYLCVVHGRLTDRTAESCFVKDRGDGLRGSYGVFRRPQGGPPAEARRAITDVRLVERLHGASLVECILSTGRQHQIRIHLSEDGHPLVGEKVYVRDYAGTRIEADRPMLHAYRLGFVHPRSEELLRFESPLPKDFDETLRRLRRGR